MTTATPTSTRPQIETGTWDVDQAHTRVGFAVKHMGVTTVRGEFREFEGALEIGEDLGSSRAYGTVNAESVSTNQPQRDEHLRSADFFGVEDNPELRFESTRIEPVDEDSFRVIGDLTMNGVTNEVELLAEVGGSEIGSQGEERIGLEVTGQISRRAFAMKFDAALGSGNAVVADKVKLALDVAAVKRS
jgi:polyisoprenoid-binding protein YceI